MLSTLVEEMSFNGIGLIFIFKHSLGSFQGIMNTYLVANGVMLLLKSDTVFYSISYIICVGSVNK